MVFKSLMSNYLAWISLLPLSLDILYTRFINFDETGFFNRSPEAIIFTLVILGISIFVWNKNKIKLPIITILLPLSVLFLIDVYTIVFIENAIFNGKYSYVLLLTIILILLKPPSRSEIIFAIDFFISILIVFVILSIVGISFFSDFVLSGHASRIESLGSLLPSRLQGFFGSSAIIGMISVTIALYYSITKDYFLSWVVIILMLVALVLTDSRSALVAGFVTSSFIIVHKFYHRININKKLLTVFFWLLFYLFLLGFDGFFNNYSHRIQIWSSKLTTVSQDISSESSKDVISKDVISKDVIKTENYQLSHNFLLDVYSVGGRNYLLVVLLFYLYFLYGVVVLDKGNYVGMSIGLPTFLSSLLEFGIIPTKLNTPSMFILLSLLLVFISSSEKKHLNKI